MRASGFVKVAAAAIGARRPLLVKSDPGVGKSSLVAVASLISGADLLVSHPVVSDPTDAKGLPWIAANKSEATFLPFGDLAQALRAKRETVWFLDDFGQASPAVQASFMQLLLARRVNGHKLPDCVTFMAATNLRTAGMGVSGMLEPVKSRFASIVTLDAHIDDWVEWAGGAGINETLIAYLRFDAGMLHVFEASSDMTNSPSPRTWANLSDVLSWGLTGSDEREAADGSVGEGAAGQFFAFREQVGHLPSVEKIMANPDSFDFHDTRPEVLYALVTTLSIRATRQTFGAVCQFAERLEAHGRGELSSLLMRDTFRRSPDLKATPEYAAILTGPVGAIMSGSHIS